DVADGFSDSVPPFSVMAAPLRLLPIDETFARSVPVLATVNDAPVKLLASAPVLVFDNVSSEPAATELIEPVPRTRPRIVFSPVVLMIPAPGPESVIALAPLGFVSVYEPVPVGLNVRWLTVIGVPIVTVAPTVPTNVALSTVPAFCPALFHATLPGM